MGINLKMDIPEILLIVIVISLPPGDNSLHLPLWKSSNSDGCLVYRLVFLEHNIRIQKFS